MAKANAKDDGEIVVMEVQTGLLECYVLGESPLILNRLSEKTKRELLLPKGKKNAAEKASTLKHDPYAEFTASAHTFRAESDSPTLLGVPATAFKGAIRSAALDMPGSSKAQIGRLTYVEGELISVYGIPQLHMSPVRSADAKKTPDIRTRVIIPQWAACIQVRYVIPLLRQQSVVNLIAAAGLYIGVGDWRPEKGSGNFGRFKIVPSEDARMRHIVKHGIRKAQESAMRDPECYDDETRELLEWSQAETGRRGFKIAKAA